MKIALSPRDRTALLLAASLLLALFSYYLVLAPLSRYAGRLRTANTRASFLVARGRQAFLRYRAELPRLPELQAAYRKATAAVPAGEDLPPFLHNLDAYAAATGVRILSFTPDSAPPTSGPGYTAYRCTLTFRGANAQAVAFLRALETSTRLVGIREAQFTSQNSTHLFAIRFHLYAKG